MSETPMSTATLEFSFILPIADRRRSMDFYSAAFDFETIGELAEDGIPEPLQISA